MFVSFFLSWRALCQGLARIQVDTGQRMCSVAHSSLCLVVLDNVKSFWLVVGAHNQGALVSSSAFFLTGGPYAKGWHGSKGYRPEDMHGGTLLPVSGLRVFVSCVCLFLS